jgi:glycosyltransferase involved in cell wall biosynthesis
VKILVVITRGDSIGGAQTHVLTLAKMLNKNGHDVLICYGGKLEGPFNKLLTAAGINCVTVPNLKREISLIADIRSVFKLRRIYKQFRPDVVSLHSSKAGIVGRMSSLFSGIPVVFTVHGWAFTEGVGGARSVFYRLIEKSLAKLASKIIVVSHYDKAIALQNRVAGAGKLEVVHNGIDVSAAGHVLSAGKDLTNIVMVARFDEQKDHESLIYACEGIENIKVHLAGDGPGLDDMIALTEKLKIRDRFVFYGYTDKVEEILSHADVFALISNWEGFPISTLEAMNHGLPVIISDVGGAKEAVVDGETGYVIKRKDILDLKAKLLSLINNPVLRQSMGLEGRKILIRNFSSEVMYINTIRVFERAIGN